MASMENLTQNQSHFSQKVENFKYVKLCEEVVWNQRWNWNWIKQRLIFKRRY